MPRNPDLPCSVCGTPRWRNYRSSLPEGEATCRPCRQGASEIRTHVYRLGVQHRKIFMAARPRSKRKRWTPKPSPEYRGYGYAHRQERKKWKAIVDEHGAFCTRCHQYMPAGSTFDLDHSEDRTTYLGVAHPSCNRGAGGAKARANERARIRASRNW